MAENEDLIDVSNLLKKTQMIFHGKTYVSKRVYNLIIQPADDAYSFFEEPDTRLFELVRGGHNGEALDIRKPHPANQLRCFEYCLHTLDGDRFFKVTCEHNYFLDKNGVITIRMDDE